MLTTVTGESGTELDAKVEVENGKIVLHSRGGAFNKPNLRNPDYREALAAILSRLLASRLVPARVLVDSREAHKHPEAKRVVIKAGELRGPVKELVARIAKGVAAFGRKPGAGGHGNQNKRLLIEVPGASEDEILAVLGQSAPMPPIIYFNVGWMKYYAGPDLDDPVVGGHAWLADHEQGGECFNFLATKAGKVEGYRPPGERNKVNINRLGGKPGDDSIEGALAVWLAREPGSGKTLIVGWYRDATVYRDARPGAFRLNEAVIKHSVTASKENAILVPPGARSFRVPSSRTAPGAKADLVRCARRERARVGICEWLGQGAEPCPLGQKEASASQH